MSNPNTPLHDLAAALRPWAARFELDIPDGPGDACAAVNALFALAHRTHAEGFLLDPRPDHLDLSLWREGALRPVASLPKRHQAAYTAALKAPAALDVAELRLPQDGRVRLRLDGELQDVHVSTLPVVWGERVACRFAELGEPTSLEGLGLDQGARRALAACLARTRGVLVVAGPRLEDRHRAALAALAEATRPGRAGVIVSARPPAQAREWAAAARLAPHLGLDHAQALKAAARGGVQVVLSDEPRGPKDLAALAELVRDGTLVVLALAEGDLEAARRAFEEAGEVAPGLARELLGVLVVRSAPRPCAACGGEDEVAVRCRGCYGAGWAGRDFEASTRFFPG